MTTHGMQHLGLLYAMDPGLTALYQDPEELQAARERYLAHVHTHPLMASLLVGLLLALEQLIVTHKMPAQHMQNLVTTTATTFSALGDSFFSGTIAILLSLSICISVLHGYPYWGVALAGVFFLLVFCFRLSAFYLGLQRGLLVLSWIRRLNLINWGERIKMLNALLLAVIFWEIAGAAQNTWGVQTFFWGVFCLGCGFILVGKMSIPRILILTLVLLFALL